MVPDRPSLRLLSSLTDEHVLRALFDRPQLTRAELSEVTGISKPTISESIRRLEGAGLVADTGKRTKGPGRSGSYYSVAGDLGVALVVSIAPAGITAEAVDVYGAVRSSHVEPLPRLPRPAVVTKRLALAAERVAAQAARPVRLAVVSAADPVDRATGRLVHLPDAPFLIGELDPVGVLNGLIRGPIHVDNDVNWAARAERHVADSLDDFAYLHLGDGLGCAVVCDGEVRRGHRGLAGEVAHLLTTGPGGRAVPLIEVFGPLGVRRPASTAIDSAALIVATGRNSRMRRVVTTAVAGAVAALVNLHDPSVVVIGGEWGPTPVLLAALEAEVAASPRPTQLRAALAVSEPSLTGARLRAVADLRASVLERGRAAP